MRAKFKVNNVARYEGRDDVQLIAVCPPSFDKDGNHEDSQFSKYTPTGEIKISVTNPALLGALTPGDAYFIDFTKVQPTESKPTND